MQSLRADRRPADRDHPLQPARRADGCAGFGRRTHQLALDCAHVRTACAHPVDLVDVVAGIGHSELDAGIVGPDVNSAVGPDVNPEVNNAGRRRHRERRPADAAGDR